MSDLVTKANTALRGMKRLTNSGGDIATQAHRNGSALTALRDAKALIDELDRWSVVTGNTKSAGPSPPTARERLEVSQAAYDLRAEVRTLTNLSERHALLSSRRGAKASAEEMEKNEADSILVRSRNALLKELHTVEEVSKRILLGSDKLKGIRDTLHGTDTALSVTQKKVKKLLAIKTVDDILFYISFVVLVAVFMYLVYCRLIRFSF